MTVRDIIAEPLEVMKITNSRQETDEKVREIASKCRLNLEHLRRYPHAFSGGQRQRISIARALAIEIRCLCPPEKAWGYLLKCSKFNRHFEAISLTFSSVS